MSNLYRFSIAHGVFPVDLWGLQCDAGVRAGRSERKAPSWAALGWLACRKKAIFTDHTDHAAPLFHPAHAGGGDRGGKAGHKKATKSLDTGLEWK
jgi:hypothetical protein